MTRKRTEEDALAEATRHTVEEYWDLPVFYGDQFFRTAEDWADHLDAEGLEPNVEYYAWGTKPIPFRLRGDYAVERALEDHYDGASEHITPAEVVRLQKLLDDWADEQGIVSYEHNYEHVVIVERPAQPATTTPSADPTPRT